MTERLNGASVETVLSVAENREVHCLLLTVGVWIS